MPEATQLLIGGAMQIVISFRGTQPTNVWDWITDAQLVLTETCPDPVNGGLRTCRDLGDEAKPDGEGKTIHSGFYVSYRCAPSRPPPPAAAAAPPDRCT